MKLRVNKRNDGSYFVQKRFMFFWFDCTSDGEICTLFAEGCCYDFLEESEAISEMNRIHYIDSARIKFEQEYDKDNKIDKNYEIKYKT